MTRSKINLPEAELHSFSNSMHLSATNEVVALHNKSMLKTLNQPVAHCYAAQRRQVPTKKLEYDQLATKILFALDNVSFSPATCWLRLALLMVRSAPFAQSYMH